MHEVFDLIINIEAAKLRYFHFYSQQNPSPNNSASHISRKRLNIFIGFHIFPHAYMSYISIYEDKAG